MLELKFIRENPDIVKKDLKKRNDTEKINWVDDLIKKDKEHRILLKKSEELRHKRNTITSEINRLKKAGKDISSTVKEAKELPAKINSIEEDIKKIRTRLSYYLMGLPNILHKSVPQGKDDTENKVTKTWGKPKKPDFKLKSHGELIEKLNLGNFEDASKVSGTGFNYLFGDLALLDMALIKFAVDFLVKKGFTLVEPPLMLRRKPYEGVTDLADFESMMYKIDNEDL